MLACCEVPDSIAFVYTTGSLIALNKDSEAVRKKRTAEGKQPRERPINQGTMFLKLAFELALRSPAASEAAASLLPIQQGLGSKRGMELISHSCTGFYEAGYAILKKDATNGFQEIFARENAPCCGSQVPLTASPFSKVLSARIDWSL